MARPSRYFSWFFVQTLGAFILLWHSVPMYRQAITDPAGLEVRPERLIWSLLAIALMQTGYWLRHRFNPPLPRLRNALVGHIILFVGRMSLVLATATFGLVFLAREPEIEISAFRYVVLIAGLFALFCYTQELERLGRGLIRPEAKPDPAK